MTGSHKVIGSIPIYSTERVSSEALFCYTQARDVGRSLRFVRYGIYGTELKHLLYFFAVFEEGAATGVLPAEGACVAYFAE